VSKKKRTGKNARKKARRKIAREIGNLVSWQLGQESLLSKIFKIHEVKGDEALRDIVLGGPEREEIVFTAADFSREVDDAGDGGEDAG
jgi:hypothetical protein